MTKKLILKISRTQECTVCVEVPDDAQTWGIYKEDPEELLKGVAGIDWECVDMDIDDVDEWTQEAEDECSAEIELKEPYHLK